MRNAECHSLYFRICFFGIAEPAEDATHRRVISFGEVINFGESISFGELIHFGAGEREVPPPAREQIPPRPSDARAVNPTYYRGTAQGG